MTYNRQWIVVLLSAIAISIAALLATLGGFGSARVPLSTVGMDNYGDGELSEGNCRCLCFGTAANGDTIRICPKENYRNGSCTDGAYYIPAVLDDIENGCKELIGGSHCEGVDFTTGLPRNGEFVGCAFESRLPDGVDSVEADVL